ncbi:membrane protein [Kineosporia sp. NBRC 101677]|uniref:MMPL family transporter n=1 Tax=Kineosporia sp. NBRC 101677 TaxID=3032197 RepID=UPI0024A26B3E|nr:MMPL family transporter [Kineosporia sp. NBRC 101677]GLY18185.1 membrane protein [Kineosporia sp. NBRC 101677]
MAWQLFRLGRWSFIHRRIVTVVWIALLALAGAGSVTLAGQTNDNFTLPGLESTEAFDLIEQRAPDSNPEGATARIVFEAPEGETIKDNQEAITKALAAVVTEDVQQPVADPVTAGTVSQDGRVGYATVTYTVIPAELSDADKDALTEVKTLAEDAGLRAAIGGDAMDAVPHAGTAEVIGIGIAFVVLLITFGSLVAAGMPLLTAVIGVGIGYAGISTLTGFVDLSSVTPALGSMLGLAVGIDYALFIMSRYQHEARTGRPLADAAGAAVGTAGSAVIFAGLTVIIALAGLSITGIAFLTQMGLAAAAMVAVAVLIALTLLPALLGFAGTRVLRGGIKGLKQLDPEDDSQRTMGRRWVEAVSRFRWPALIGGVAIAAVISIPVASMELAIPDDATSPSGSDNRVAYDLITDNFGAGANGPLVIVVDTANAADKMAAVQSVQQTLGGIQDDVAALIPPLTTDTKEAQAAFQQQLEQVNLANFTIIPKSGPSDAETKELVNTIRDSLAGLPDETGARAMVTGQTAVGVDISEKLADVFPLYLVVVVGLAFILLVLVFRSILVPLKAALGFLLSVGVAIGSVVAVFQWGWLNELVGLDVTTPVLFILPLLLTGVLFGLAMDYEVFLVTRMREAYVHGTEARQAVIDGFAHSARVVTAAAIIMFGVFAGFALGDDVMIKTIGFGLAVGVIADAFLVRMLIVPAVMAIIGKGIWWLPKWLDRALPNLDIEGEALTEKLGPAPGPKEPVAVGK